MSKPLICLMGPTASGKTPLAVALVQRLPCEIISVDSAMIYRGMDIGTAKPDNSILKIAPHRLIDIVDPSDHYSAGQFHADALREIESITARGKVPLLVGGTMMYFRALQKGIAVMPPRDAVLRAELQSRADKEGWAALHQSLAAVDPEAGVRIHVSDSQRIQRALEVFMLTGKTITELQKTNTDPLAGYRWLNLAVAPADRTLLHERIEQRFKQMLAQGFIHEVKRLRDRGDLTADMPSIRSVGYRQAWDYFEQRIDYDEMTTLAITATRQLAKRQLTWLRSWPDLHWFDSTDPAALVPVVEDAVKSFVQCY